MFKVAFQTFSNTSLINLGRTYGASKVTDTFVVFENGCLRVTALKGRLLIEQENNIGVLKA